MRIQRQRCRERKVRLRAGEVTLERGVGGAQQGRQEAQVGERGGERGQHEVADAQQREAAQRGHGERGAQDEQQNLRNVVVALEVAEGRVAAQDFGDEREERGFAAGELRVAFVCKVSLAADRGRYESGGFPMGASYLGGNRQRRGGRRA